MEIVIVCVGAFVLDAVFGDPMGFPHIVVGMGKLIRALEKLLRRVFPKTKAGELCGGVLLALLLPAAAYGFGFGVIYLCSFAGSWLRIMAEMFFCWQCLAIKSLRDAGKFVYDALMTGDIAKSREAVGRIVGRDTAELDFPAVIRAAVESVAESTSDGVIAPLFYMMLGGAPLAMAYKAINTMDSMVGYKNEKYLYFGRAAARFDDLVNLIPSRISGLLIIFAAWVCGLDPKNSWRIFKRDRYKHKSPNSAQTESAVAGALHVRLAGNAFYFGKLYEKPYQGDDDRPIEPKDILSTNRLMTAASTAALVLFSLVRTAVVIWL